MSSFKFNSVIGDCCSQLKFSLQFVRTGEGLDEILLGGIEAGCNELWGS